MHLWCWSYHHTPIQNLMPFLSSTDPNIVFLVSLFSMRCFFELLFLRFLRGDLFLQVLCRHMSFYSFPVASGIWCPQVRLMSFIKHPWAWCFVWERSIACQCHWRYYRDWCWIFCGLSTLLTDQCLAETKDFTLGYYSSWLSVRSLSLIHWLFYLNAVNIWNWILKVWWMAPSTFL